MCDMGATPIQRTDLNPYGDIYMQQRPQPTREFTDFEEAFIAEFPEDAARGIITSKQINEIKKMYGTPDPFKIKREGNRTGKRGEFHFNAGFDVPYKNEIVKSEIVIKERETDIDMDARIRKTYSNMRTLVESVADNKIRSLLISGHAGLGKSYETKQALESHGKSDYVFITGYLKTTGLFRLLYENRFENQVVVFDDSDKILYEMESLNLLKNALELKQTRRISWLSEKTFTLDDGEIIPKSFDYEGSVIFLTNIDFASQILKDNALSPHLSALDSRSIYLDLDVKTNREILIRMKQVISDSDILSSKGLDKDAEDLLMSYLTDNIDRLKDLSLRSIEKLAALYSTNREKWRDLADAVMLTKR